VAAKRLPGGGALVLADCRLAVRIVPGKGEFSRRKWADTI